MSNCLLVFVNENRLLPKLGNSLFTFEVAVPTAQGESIPADIVSIGLIDNTTSSPKFIAKFAGLLSFDEDNVIVYAAEPGSSFYSSRSQATWPEWTGAITDRSIEPLQTLVVTDTQLGEFCDNLGTRGHRRIGSLDPAVMNYLGAHVKTTYKSKTASMHEISSILRIRYALDELSIRASDIDSLDAFESTTKSAFHTLNLQGLISIAQGTLGLKDVDLGLRPITDRDFIPRKFAQKTQQDLEGASRKLERAEFAHQLILKDVSELLLSRGHEPLMSESVDLALDLQSTRVIFEIKSATKDNFEQQFQTGVIQIKMYEFAMKTESNPEVIPFLVIEKPTDALIDMESISGFSEFVGCRLFLWDAALDKKSRFVDLVKSLGSL